PTPERQHGEPQPEQGPDDFLRMLLEHIGAYSKPGFLAVLLNRATSQPMPAGIADASIAAVSRVMLSMASGKNTPISAMTAVPAPMVPPDFVDVRKVGSVCSAMYISSMVTGSPRRTFFRISRLARLASRFGLFASNFSSAFRPTRPASSARAFTGPPTRCAACQATNGCPSADSRDRPLDAD